MYAGRIIGECTLRSNLNKGESPECLFEEGVEPDEMIRPIRENSRAKTDSQ
ncbi:protein of unknown function [Paenibacillus alvei]|uniref:Uncharacterized protein n=1 Tax=Paenibacillus alvei TaxID=44250 RepID=A0A383R498_PAEAL|nr:protein of unknown function [Paenibacillus alvei]